MSGAVPGIERQPLKKLEPDAAALSAIDRAVAERDERLPPKTAPHPNTMANAAVAPETLFLLNSTQILDDRHDSFFYDLLRVARHVQQ